MSWVAPDVLGLPGVVGEQLLLPVRGGLTSVAAPNGNPGIVPTVIPVDRAGYDRLGSTSRRSADMVVELRGSTVVGLSD